MTPRLSRVLASPAPGSALAKVLVVGEAAPAREALGHHLQIEGYDAHAVVQGAEALEKLRAEPFDLVLLDVQGAAAGGTQFLESLRNDAELAQVPVVVVVAEDDLEVIDRCLELGADDYLPASFNAAILRARLRAALDRRRVRAVESVAREMTVARNIQRDFLPETLPVAMGVQLEAALQPARHVSGDFYDAFVLAPGSTLVLVVGDVCDKGFGAALFMALFRSLIRASADPVGGGAIQMIGGRRTIVRESLEAAAPSDLLTRVAGFTNDYIARLHGRTNMFATAFLAALTPSTGHFDYVNAGHEPAVVVAPDGSTRELRPTGPALGLLPGSLFSSGDGTLGRGESLVAFTDGLVEARNAAGEVFGGERLREALRANHRTAPDLVRGVTAALQAFTGPADPHDDVTIIAATRTIG